MYELMEPATPRHVLIAVNRKAGDGRKAARVEALRAALTTQGCTATVVEHLGEAMARATGEFREGGLHAVVCAGGDGTMNAMLNGTPSGTPLAVFPCGTENLLARHLRLPHDPAEAAAVVAMGRRQTFDVGRVGERLFLLTLSVGFDAAVVHRLHDVRAGNIKHLSYIGPIARVWREYAYPELRVTVEGIDESALRPPPSPFSCRWCFVQNLPAYAMRLNFTPQARGDDGLLDYCLFQQGGAWSGVRHLWNVARGAHHRLPDTHVGRTLQLRIDTVDPALAADVPVQVDGDPAGSLPITVETLPGYAALIVP